MKTASKDYHATTVSKQEWIDANVAELPHPLSNTFTDISSLVDYAKSVSSQQNHSFTREDRLFDSKRSKYPSVHGVTSTSVYHIIRATVLPSNKGRQYITVIAINKMNKQIIHRSCTVLQVL